MDKLDELNIKLDKILALIISQKSVLTLDEAALYMGLSKSYLYKLTSGSKIPYSKPNGKLNYFEKEQLNVWMLRNKQKTLDELGDESSTYFLNRK